MATVTLIQFQGDAREAREALGLVRPGRRRVPARRARPSRHSTPARKAAGAVAGGVAREVGAAMVAGVWACLWARISR